LRACVIYASRFGNTEKIARAIGSGINEAGVQTECLNAIDVRVDSLKDCDLICVGGPTEAFSASKPMKEFLGELKGSDFSGKHGFAFDTKLDSRFSGSAGGFIESKLRNLGLKIVAPRESAIVYSLKGKSGTSGATLKNGEEQRFQQLGRQVATNLLASAKSVPA
jgi:flavodoxin